jgi:sugar-specific transcriptional regulator TrmB
LILDELVKTGFVVEIPSAVKKLYEAKPPEEVFATAKERMRIAETALPNIESLMRKKQGKTQTLYFEGLSGLEQALKYRINDQRGEEAIGFYAASSDMPESAMELTKAWMEECKKLNIKIRGFIPKKYLSSSFAKNDKAEGRSFKTLPNEAYSSRVSLDTVGDMVRFIDTISPIPQATIIESAEAAKAMRQIFNRMWEKEENK